MVLPKNRKITKLSDCTTLKEALPLLQEAMPGTRQLVKLAFDMADPADTKRTLQEAEQIMDAEEKEKEKLKEAQVPGANKDGQSHSSTASETPAAPATPEHKGGITEQPGQSQLKETEDGYDELQGTNTADSHNVCVIQKMAEGMSQVEAQNACASEMKIMESKMQETLKKIVLPIFKRKDQEIKGLKEALKIVDAKLQEATTKGTIKMGKLQETTATAPGSVSPIGPDFSKIVADPYELEAYRKDLLQRI